MLPDQQLSSVALPSAFLPPDGNVVSPLEDFELGGVGLNDPSQGLKVKVWRAFYEDDQIKVEADDVAAVTKFTGAGVTELALAFDQNMRPAIAFTQNGLGRLQWFDTVPSAEVITDFPDTKNLRLTMDDKRRTQELSNDIILAYVRAETLFFRAQRDRFTIEYNLGNVGTGRLTRIGMNTTNRVQFEFVAGADPDAAVWPISAGIWEVPADSGFSVGEMVGTWAEGFGFLGFRRIELLGETMIIRLSPPGVAVEDFPTSLVIGYPYEARWEALPLSAPDGRGPMLGRKRRLVRAILSVENAVSLLANEVPVLPAVGEDQSSQFTSHTGEFEARFLGWSSRDKFEVRSTAPYSAIIRALLREYNQ